MNLRKDHCRILQKQTADTLNHIGTAGHGGDSLPAPTSRTARALAGVVRANEPRRGMCQGKLTEASASHRPVRGVLWVIWRVSNVKTTLGNGYLGSRIDEERSEMRYLV